MATYGYARVSLKEIDAVRGRRAHAQEPGRLPIECERFQTIPASREVQQSKPICDLAVLPSLLIPCSEAVSGSRNSSKKAVCGPMARGMGFLGHRSQKYIYPFKRTSHEISQKHPLIT
jgi:hypothetical protein